MVVIRAWSRKIVFSEIFAWKLKTQRIFDGHVAKDLGKNNYLKKGNFSYKIF